MLLRDRQLGNTDRPEAIGVGECTQILVVGVDDSGLVYLSDCDDLAVKLDLRPSLVAPAPFLPFVDCLLGHECKLKCGALVKGFNAKASGLADQPNILRCRGLTRADQGLAQCWRGNDDLGLGS